MNKKIHIVAGARPNFVKIAPIIWEMDKRDIPYELIHTGQHYDYEMSQVFFEQLGIPEPDFYLGVGSGGHGLQTGRILIEYEALVERQTPSLIMVFGDVNSTMAAALVGSKLHIPVAHIEAGLRSFDKGMPEEINRVMTDHISDLLFITEAVGLRHLRNEGIEKNCHVVGDVMIDTLAHFIDNALDLRIWERFGLKSDGYCLFTAHRPSNVDSRENLLKILDILKQIDMPVIFPVHPRTGNSIDRNGLREDFESLAGLKMIAPLGYLDFMGLVAGSCLVVTDSGGIQEETTYLGIRCLTLRTTTERPATIEQGTNSLCGLSVKLFTEALAAPFDSESYTPPPLLDGHASERVMDITTSFLG